MNQDFQKCLEKTIDYLSRRDHSSKELRDKLNKKKFDKDLIEKCIEWVAERGYMRPPQELSQTLSQQLSQRGKGRLYILQYLKERGLPPPESLDQEMELQNALELAQRELKQKHCNDPSSATRLDRATREKIGRKLMSRGFPLDIVRKVIYEKLTSDEN